MALFVGFYLLALGIAAGLLMVLYLEWVYTGHVSGRLALFCIIGAAIIIWSIVPRPDRFTPPGPRLDRASQPDLFPTIEEVSRTTAQEMPAEVYVRGFVMTYARALRIDPIRAAAQFLHRYHEVRETSADR